jgi:hypothetical protein
VREAGRPNGETVRSLDAGGLSGLPCLLVRNGASISMNTTQFLLLLMETPGIGDQTITTVLRKNAVLRREPDGMMGMPVDSLVKEYGIRRPAAESLIRRAGDKNERLEAAAKLMSTNGISLITLVDAIYPARLTQRMVDPPPLLFAYGNLSMLDKPLLGIANSNGAREESLAACDRAVEIAAGLGWTVVTGHNRVEYQRPALAAKRNGASICYVLDRGLIQGFGGDLTRDLFPAARIWGPAYDPLADLSLSQFGLHRNGNVASNRRRDSLVFSLADAIFAGSVKPRGIMEKECVRAMERRCPVLFDSAGIGSSGSLAQIGARAVDFDELQSILETL